MSIITLMATIATGALFILIGLVIILVWLGVVADAVYRMGWWGLIGILPGLIAVPMATILVALGLRVWGVNVF